MLNRPSDSAGKAFLAQKKRVENHLKTLRKREKQLEEAALEIKRNDDCKAEIAEQLSLLQNQTELVKRQIAFLANPANIAAFKQAAADRQTKRLKDLKDEAAALKAASTFDLEGVEELYKF